MMNIKNCLLLFILISISACIEEIPVDIEESNNEYLIIDAEIRDNDSSHSISIKLNSPSSSNFQADQPVSDAEVYIVDDEDIKYDFINNNTLVIFWNTNLVLQEGKTYQLFINYKDRSYISKKETLLSSIPITDVRTRVTNESVNNVAGNVVTSELVNVFADADFPLDEEIYIKFGVKGTYEFREIGTPSNLNPDFCYVNEIIELDNISLVSDEEVPGGTLKDQFVIQRIIDYRYSTKYCMKVYQERISKNAYDFWRLVKNEYSRTGDIFEKPPGIIRGNIEETEISEISAIGLFSVIAVDSFLHLINTSDVNSPRPQCQPFPPPPAECSNCLLLPKSTLVKPECFQ